MAAHRLQPLIPQLSDQLPLLSNGGPRKEHFAFLCHALPLEPHWPNNLQGWYGAARSRICLKSFLPCRSVVGFSRRDLELGWNAKGQRTEPASATATITRRHTKKQVCLPVCMHVFSMFVCLSVCMSACVFVCMVCFLICFCVCVCPGCFSVPVCLIACLLVGLLNRVFV